MDANTFCFVLIGWISHQSDSGGRQASWPPRIQQTPDHQHKEVGCTVVELPVLHRTNPPAIVGNFGVSYGIVCTYCIASLMYLFLCFPLVSVFLHFVFVSNFIKLQDQISLCCCPKGWLIGKGLKFFRKCWRMLWSEDCRRDRSRKKWTWSL